MPASWWSQNSFRNGGSVALHWVTWYWSGVRRAFRSVSLGLAVFMSHSITRGRRRLGSARWPPRPILRKIGTVRKAPDRPDAQARPGRRTTPDDTAGRRRYHA